MSNKPPNVPKARKQQGKQLKPTPITKMNATQRKAAVSKRPFSLP